ncbi:MAG: hypothetical protein AUG14_03565 [Candidatus Rokubacteria bacterium 13_1_20CM_2_68_19]|nr:MAG: hypothetical protein AUH18_09160 [Candidatus Rokubacteria bacterium 13_2_20CM_69_10]OLB43477.1 MAG: hypothetical protein AUI04_02315 [Candidatus Rokubacteria bacterium 13_2_20CM_2_64_8]OLC60569.1 MAG: hypothetical protein AUH76_11865 [Candidatus Rokubacteria bacterium 13_1_40CM_4_67_11]OLD30409.1 MAG: hypothetical protein AUI49_09105 [Candidatus Rokubacteria bacterium 13_1_40CM_2_68_13]OLE00633.1 MAG: hypothetical protein AUG80_01805 [Candidatus Rokubacteria bacterium 13_1_20CM_4_68_9]
MEHRSLGGTGLRVSALGFGCGNIGGLLIRGSVAERERAVARAIELGINYFDTAASYGDGQSEEHLGRALRALKVSPFVGTKVRVPDVPVSALAGAVARGLEESLRRLGRDRVDLFQLHNHITAERTSESLTVKDVRDVVFPAMARLAEQGKIGFYGITALGETASVLDVIGAGRARTAQVCYNLLNPSAGHPLPPGFPAQDFGRLLERCREQQMGVIVIRVLAAGALSGTETRHPVAAPAVDPIASAADYATDARHARMLSALVDEGHAGSLVEASLRFALAADPVSTVLLGYSSLEQLEYAAACVNKGPLSTAALARLPELWTRLARG